MNYKQATGRWGIRVRAVLAAFVVAACATPNRLIEDNRSMAQEAASDRARLNGCSAPSMKLLTSELVAPPVGRGEWAGSGRQAKYVFQADGCAKPQKFVVLCQEGNV